MRAGVSAERDVTGSLASIQRTISWTFKGVDVWAVRLCRPCCRGDGVLMSIKLQS